MKRFLLLIVGLLGLQCPVSAFTATAAPVGTTASPTADTTVSGKYTFSAASTTVNTIKVLTSVIHPDGITTTTSPRLVQTISATTFTTSATVTTSFANSNLTASITPTSASNKVLVTMSFMAITSVATDIVQIDIFRGSTSLSATNLFASVGNTTTERAHITLTYLDSPATTSATTYTLKFASANGQSVTIGNGQMQSVVLQELAVP